MLMISIFTLQVFLGDGLRRLFSLIFDLSTVFFSLSRSTVHQVKMNSHDVEIKEVTKGFLSLTAKQDIPAGSFLADVWGPVVNSPTPYTIQVGVDKHVDPDEALKRTNHSCQPNAKFIFEQRYKGVPIPGLDGNNQVFWYLVATRDIMKGENITFDYTTTEYEMAQGFKCLCGMEDCLGEVKGFKFLTSQEKARRKDQLSPVIKTLNNNYF